MNIVIWVIKMATKEKFKDFVKKNPILLNYVRDGKMTWQKFYEIYDMYGEDEAVWNDYLKGKKVQNSNSSNFDLASFIKGIDLDSIQNGVNSMQRVLGLLQDMSNKKKDTPKETYKARPLYKHFED